MCLILSPAPVDGYLLLVPCEDLHHDPGLDREISCSLLTVNLSHANLNLDKHYQ